ncbi:hypothetical protein BDD14_4117 [Edaphobacter modestus]|uniref:Uncharacterized protein n=1 Tax=Edaphobacter modestus TaxID=388466 RepID=A0A4Q7YXE7_9BACT|nr:hypothetical protein BDD14_4117 [Edaphobacter modestus]
MTEYAPNATSWIGACETQLAKAIQQRIRCSIPASPSLNAGFAWKRLGVRRNWLGQLSRCTGKGVAIPIPPEKCLTFPFRQFLESACSKQIFERCGCGQHNPTARMHIAASPFAYQDLAHVISDAHISRSNG